MSNNQVVQNGIYNLVAFTGAFVEVTDNQANLTLWTYSASLQQQWDVQATGNGTYTIQSVQYNTYVSTATPTEEGTFVGQSSMPYNWNIKLNATDPVAYVIAPDNTYSLALNVFDAHTSQNTPVQLSGCCYSGPASSTNFADWDLFQFVSASNSTSTQVPNSTVTQVLNSTTSATMNQISNNQLPLPWFAIAIVFIVLFGAVVIGIGTAWFLGYRCMNPRRGVA